MQIDDFNQIRQHGRIEPESSAAQSDQEVALVSIAVSLKRIADALDGTDNCGLATLLREQRL